MRLPPTPSEQRDQLADRVSATSYGTVLIIAALLVVDQEAVASGWGWELVAGVGIATWLAHVYAEVLGNHVRNVEAIRSHELRRAMVDGLPIPLAALLPSLALVLGRIGAMAPHIALWVAVVVAILQLLAIGAFVGMTSEQDTSSWRYAVVAAALGVGVVVMVVALGH